MAKPPSYFRRDYTPLIGGFIAENPGLISARTSLFRREIIDSLANLLADRTIERRGDAYYLRQKQRRPQSWRQRVAAWLLAAQSRTPVGATANATTGQTPAGFRILLPAGVALSTARHNPPTKKSRVSVLADHAGFSHNNESHIRYERVSFNGKFAGAGR